MSIKNTKAKFRQREARRWQSVAEWCRDKYAETKQSGYYSEYIHASNLAKFHYSAARSIMGIK